MAWRRSTEKKMADCGKNLEQSWEDKQKQSQNNAEWELKLYEIPRLLKMKKEGKNNDKRGREHYM